MDGSLLEEDLTERLEQLERQREALQEQMRRLRQRPTGRIGYLLFLLGLVLLLLAVFFSHSVSALVGIALVFWGALLFYVRPAKFVRSEILDVSVTPPVLLFHQLLDQLRSETTPVYAPTDETGEGKGVLMYLPRKDFIQKLTGADTFQDGSATKVEVLRLLPPGIGILKLLEESGTDFSRVELGDLQAHLVNTIVETLNIATSLEIDISFNIWENAVPVRFVDIHMKDSVFMPTVEEILAAEFNRHVGDPLSSALACVLAKSTRKPVTIDKMSLDSKEKLVVVRYRIEG